MRVARSDKYMEDLATRMLGFEDEAFLEFAEIFGPRLRSFFIRRGLPAGEADDLSVSCVTDISLKVNKYTSVREGGFSSWVFALAHNSMADWWRARHASEPMPENLGAAPPQQQSDEGGEGGEGDSEVVLAVRHALSLLSESDRSVVMLREMGGDYAFDEIGELLGIRGDAARVRHHRALKKLKAILEEDPRVAKFIGRRQERGQGAL